MAGSKIPGPYGCDANLAELGSGTLCRAIMPPPGPVCLDPTSIAEWSDLEVLVLARGAKSYRPPPHPQAPLPELGSLSARYESSGNPGAIGYDSTGGWSYGSFQLATKPGTLAGFLNFLTVHNPHLARSLKEAGGAKGALKGSKKFRTAWVKLTKQDPIGFAEAQRCFIQATHYDVQVAKLKKSLGIDVNARSRALQNVVWSMAVQHGNGTQTIFRNALGQRKPGDVDDESLIRALYAERSKVDKYFAASADRVKAAVRGRFKSEEQDALKMLKEEGGRSAPNVQL